MPPASIVDNQTIVRYDSIIAVKSLKHIPPSKFMISSLKNDHTQKTIATTYPLSSGDGTVIKGRRWIHSQ